MLRAAIDLAGTAWMAARRAPGSGASLLRVGKATAVALALLAAMTLPDGLWTRIVICIVVLAGYLLACWHWLLTDEDRRIVRKRIPGLRA